MFQSWIQTNEFANTKVKMKRRGHNTIQVPHPPPIASESDFIHNVKNQYIRKKNNAATLKIQTWYRKLVCWRAYRILRAHTVPKVTFIQSFVRMLWIRRPYLKYKRSEKQTASILVQRYLKRYLVCKAWDDKFHNFMVDNMSVHFRAVTLRLHSNS